MMVEKCFDKWDESIEDEYFDKIERNGEIRRQAVEEMQYRNNK